MTKRALNQATAMQKELNETMWEQLRYILSTNYDIKSEGESEIWLKTAQDGVSLEVYPSNDGVNLVHITVWSLKGGYGSLNRSQGIDTLPKAIEHIDRILQSFRILAI